MYCPHCGTQIPDDSAFCRNCGKPIPKEAPVVKSAPSVPPILANLLETVKGFFSKDPTEGMTLVAASETHEWAILLGLNVLAFAFAFAVNAKQIALMFINSLMSALESSMGGYGSILSSAAPAMGSFVNFGYFFLFGLLISILANAIVFGAYFLLEKVVHRGGQTVFGVLNTVAYSTIPFTVVCLLNMLLGLIWGFLVIPFVLIAALAQVILLYSALQKNAEDGRVRYFVFIGVCLIALFLTLLFGFLFTRAGLSASIDAAMSRYGL